MGTVRAEASAEFEASSTVVYGVLADYHQGHPSILPRRYFTHLHVERGGQGAGTLIRFGMKIGGQVREATAEVSEPEPGRVLVERVLDERGTETSFTVDPLGTDRVRVTIRTSWRAAGVPGLFERLFAPALLRRIYREQLGNLERVARGGPESQ
jgi:hypothetical protein